MNYLGDRLVIRFATAWAVAALASLCSAAGCGDESASSGPTGTGGSGGVLSDASPDGWQQDGDPDGAPEASDEPDGGCVGHASLLRTFGGSGSESARTAAPTLDDGLIMAGVTQSYGEGAWILKLDRDAEPQWQMRIGDSAFDNIYAIGQVADGGYVAAGHVFKQGEDNWGLWLIRLGADGAVLRQHRLSGGSDKGFAMELTEDGGGIVVGDTMSFGAGGTCVMDFPCSDALLVKFDSSGEIQWQRALGMNGSDEKLVSVLSTADGGFIAAGTTGTPTSPLDVWVVKLGSGGQVQWQAAYGGPDLEDRPRIVQAPDGGYFVAATTTSFGRRQDIWVLKLDSDGKLEWQGTLGGEDDDRVSDVVATPDGGIVLLGAYVNLGDMADVAVTELAGDGSIRWSRRYDGKYEDSAWSIVRRCDGALVITGATDSLSAPLSSDLFVLNLGEDGLLNPACSEGFEISDTQYSRNETNAEAHSTQAVAVDTDLLVTDSARPIVNTDAAAVAICP